MNSKTILELDKKRAYDINLNALINFEEATGKSLMKMKAGDEFSLKDIRALLWAGLNEFEEISLEEAGSLVNIHNIEKVSKKIMEVYENAIPEAKGSEGVKNKTRPVG